MRMQVSILKSLVFVFTITLLTLGILGNLSYGAPAHPQIYWTDLQTGKIQRANLDGTNVQDVVAGAGWSPVWSIALDVASGKMYWTSWSSTGKIQQANLDGSNVQDIVVTTGLDFPIGIALDTAGEKIYWTYNQYDADTETYTSGKIQCANLDGSNIQDITTTRLGAPAGIALDVAGGKVYWTVPEIGKIQCANLDGSNVQDIITTQLVEPSYIALDVAGGKMYWTDSGTGKIQCANLDGSNIQDIITTRLGAPVGIALDVAGGKMYWTDNSTGKIQRANLDGTNVQNIVTGLTEPISIALSIPRFTVDVNGDSVVNIQDLVLVAGAFGKTGENAADVNGDGVVNIQDLVLVAGAFGTTTPEPSFPPIEDLTIPDAVFFSATPASGYEISTIAIITLTFSSDPGAVTSSAGGVSGGGKTRTVTGPFTPGPLTLTIRWTNGDGSLTLNYNVIPRDVTAPTVTGGTILDGEDDVDFDKINEGQTIEITFSEDVSGDIALQTKAGDDVGWIGKVEGTKGTLELIAGKEVGPETTYAIKGKVSDAAGNETEVSITFTTTFLDEPAIENLVVHWSFERFAREGDWVFDSSGNGNDGRIIGQPWRFPAGKYGEALGFDGGDDAVVVPNSTIFGEENITLMGWFFPDNAVTNRALIVKKGSFAVGFNNINELLFVVQPNFKFVESVSRLQDSEWSHFAVTYDGQAMRIYINGELENAQPNDIPIAQSEADLVIGQGFAGVIDEVRFYNKALTEDEISIMADFSW